MNDKKDLYRWSSESIDIAWDRRLCIHVGECTRATGDLFESGRDPWCRPDAASAGDAVEVVERCPTGALTHRRKDGGVEETHDAENTVAVANNGPLYLRGTLDIDGTDSDMPGVTYRAALCRCGASSNKPFCDNSHETTEFRDHGAIGETGEGFDAPGGVLQVRRAKNGPLLVTGNVTLVNAAGRVAWRGTKCALCRCGASKNKPFCDGAHKDIGFEAD